MHLESLCAVKGGAAHVCLLKLQQMSGCLTVTAVAYALTACEAAMVPAALFSACTFTVLAAALT